MQHFANIVMVQLILVVPVISWGGEMASLPSLLCELCFVISVLNNNYIKGLSWSYLAEYPIQLANLACGSSAKYQAIFREISVHSTHVIIFLLPQLTKQSPASIFSLKYHYFAKPASHENTEIDHQTLLMLLQVLSTGTIRNTRWTAKRIWIKASRV